MDFFSKHGHGYLIKPVRIEKLISTVKKIVNETEKELNVKSFIVHGHDDTSKLELKNYLQNVLKMPEPIILHEQLTMGRTIIEKFEAHSSNTDVVFVLLTPDDVGAVAQESNKMKRRARQNVIFEMGYFLGKMQRGSGRVILLHKGDIELPSDISGIIYIDITNGISAAGEDIRREISGLL